MRRAALLRDERRHVRGMMKRSVKDNNIMSGHKFAERGGGAGRSANLCVFVEATAKFEISQRIAFTNSVRERYSKK